jgi:hypothetical protein
MNQVRSLHIEGRAVARIAMPSSRYVSGHEEADNCRRQALAYVKDHFSSALQTRSMN